MHHARFSKSPQTLSRWSTFALICLAIACGTLSHAAEVQNQVETLEDGKPIEREIAGSQTHSYHILLAADQYLHLEIEQHTINVVVALFAPDSKKLFELDGEKRKQGTETLTVIADVAGSYRLDLRPADKNDAAGRYEAKILARRSPTGEERTLEEARRLHEEARSLRQKGKYDEAISPVERAIAIREKVLGADHVKVAESLNLLAIIYDDKHEYAKAEPLNVRALTIREKTLGPDHPDVARSLFNLAWLYKVKQEFAKAEATYQRVLAIQEKALGPDHTEVATTLNDMAVLYNQLGNHDQSILINQRVLAIREKVLGPDDPGVAKALNNLARVYERKGDYTQAEELLLRSVSIWEKALGPEHPEVAFGLDSLARVYYVKGDYVKAEPLFQRALAIREKALGPDHPEVGTTSNNLGQLYSHKGDYAKAETLLKRDLEITEKRLGPDHPFAAPPLMNLARIYQLQGDYAKAEPLYQRALAILEKALGPNHQDVGWSLTLLGQLYLEQKHGREAQAESFFQRSLMTLEKSLGPDHHRIAAPLSGLAALAASRGDLAKAESFYQRALTIKEKVLGPDHPEVAQLLGRLATLYRAQGDAEKALALFSRAQEIRERHLSHNLPLGSERQMLSYLKLFAEDINQALSLHGQLFPRDPKALRLAFKTLLRRKGRGLDEMSNNIASLRRRALPQDQELFARLVDTRSQLANLTLRGPGASNPGVYRSLLLRLENNVDQLEAEVSARSAEFRALSSPITLESIQSTVPENAALVEFALYQPTDPRSANQPPPRYAVYLITRSGSPQWADLGEAAPIDRAIEAWRQALRDPQRADVQKLGRTVDRFIMQPVRGLLGAAQHLLISTDGPLNLIPFAALVDEQNRYLADSLTITYLASGRDLLPLQVARASKGGPVIVADPEFGEPALLASAGDGATRSRQNGRPAAGRVRVDYSQVFFGPLPGVGDEVRALKSLLPQATFLMKQQATEAAVKHISAPSILHIATHGFFLQDVDEKSEKQLVATRGGDDVRLGKWAARVANPLLRSGLALAGANQGRSGDDDGILTAMEAAGLDLWGTRLVVLSACDTGVGEVKNGDGVYGLRRALVLAGSESQMISLWPVSDRSTRDLMAGYYQRLMAGQGRSAALREVQRQMLRSKPRGHPYYWASFIQSGAWASLEGKQ